MFKTIFLSAGLVLAALLPVAAQRVQLSVEGGAQHSWIPDYSERVQLNTCPPGSGYCGISSSADINYSYQEKPGAYLKGVLTYAVNERVQLYHNLNLNLLRFKSKTEMSGLSSDGSQSPPSGDPGIIVGVGKPIGSNYGSYYCRDAEGNLVPCPEPEPEPMYTPSDDRLGETSILYLSQEIGGRYRVMPRLWVQGGVDISHRLYSQVYVMHFNGGFGGSEPAYSVEKDKSGQGFNSLLLGLQTGLSYELTEKFALTAAYQYSLAPDAGNNANLFRLGVQYRLRSW